MFEQAFKNVDDILWKESGCTTELDYTEQTSWLLFLKYLDGLEQDRAAEAELEGKKYEFILDKAYRWESWATPKTKTGALDHNKAKTGPDLIDFVNGKLFPYLQGFKHKATGPNTIEYKIGEIFGERKNKITSGYNLREILDHIDELRFRSQAEKHELSHLYEAKIRNMGNAGRNGGEYYAPRPLICAIIKVVKPTVGERVYDGAAGSAGFLCEAFDFMKAKSGLTTKEVNALQERTFYGKEKKSLATHNVSGEPRPLRVTSIALLWATLIGCGPGLVAAASPDASATPAARPVDAGVAAPGLDDVPGCVVHTGEIKTRTETTKLAGGRPGPTRTTGSCSISAECAGRGSIELACQDETCICRAQASGRGAKRMQRLALLAPCTSAAMARTALWKRCLPLIAPQQPRAAKKSGK